MAKFKITETVTITREIIVDGDSEEEVRENYDNGDYDEELESCYFDGQYDSKEANIEEENEEDEEESLPTEEWYHRPSNVETDKEFEEYIYACLLSDYEVHPISFTYEFDNGKIYVSNIKWADKEEE